MRTISRPTNGLSSRMMDSQALVSAVEGASRALVVGWLRLAVASLAVAGIFALLVAVARTPRVQNLVGEEYFRVSLVGHVAFSLNVWLLSFAGALWAMALARLSLSCNKNTGLAGLWLASAGTAMMAGAGIVGMGRPSLADYLPMLEHPVFAIGLALFFTGVSLGAINFLVTLRLHPGPLSLDVSALRIGAITYLMAVATLVVALTAGWKGDWAVAAWGPGHLLQLVNGATMVAAWLLLLRASLPPRAHALLRATLPFFLLPAVIVPLIYLLPGPLLKGPVGSITWAGLAIPTVAAWGVVGRAIIRGHPRTLSLGPLAVSLLLFGVGVLAALLGLEGDTKVTAHYHGTVGAVTVAFMGLAYQLLSALGIKVRWPRLAGIQPLVYGCGLLLLIAGLYWAASFGGQRKAFEAFAEQSSIVGPMSFIGIGALLAIVGGASFVFGLGGSLLAKPWKPSLPTEEWLVTLPPS